MDKNAFFSVSDLNTDREKANDLSVYAFKVLFKIFAAASLVMWALTPLVCFFDRTTDAIRDVLCFGDIFGVHGLVIFYDETLQKWLTEPVSVAHLMQVHQKMNMALNQQFNPMKSNFI